MSPKTSTAATPPFEARLARLEQIVGELDDEQVPLDHQGRLLQVNRVLPADEPEGVAEQPEVEHRGDEPHLFGVESHAAPRAARHCCRSSSNSNAYPTTAR